MKHKTSELEGALLAAAVAKAEGFEVVSMRAEQDPEFAYCMVRCGKDETPEKYAPQRHAAQGLAIIEREHIRLDWQTPFGWFAYPGLDMPIDCLPCMDAAATPLIAAMRAYVASKLGEEVEL